MAIHCKPISARLKSKPCMTWTKPLADRVDEAGGKTVFDHHPRLGFTAKNIEDVFAGQTKQEIVVSPVVGPEIDVRQQFGERYRIEALFAWDDVAAAYAVPIGQQRGETPVVGLQGILFRNSFDRRRHVLPAANLWF